MSVYFAQAGAYVKIGYSADPFQRIGTVTFSGRRPDDLPRGADATLIGWVPGGRNVEAAWHLRFMGDRVSGEWFYLDPTVVRDLIWSNPRGVDVCRMSAMAALAAQKYPTLTRDQIAQAGIPIEATQPAEALTNLGGAA